tara:strand:- start:1652 stop:2335 length:684 start_codon:yes stop_codon:yes gene_type:complete
MKEQWKDVVGYEGLYKASNNGNIRSLDRFVDRSNGGYNVSGQVMSQTLHRNGYNHVSLYKNGKHRTMTVHGVVVTAFLDHDPSTSSLVVNHINHDRLDNRLSNLEITTQRDNCSKRKIKYSSSYTGVIHMKKYDNYRASIGLGERHIHLGTFDTEEEAHKYYLAALESFNKGEEINTAVVPKTSKYKGVSLHKATGRWRAYTKGKHLGYFTVEADANDAVIKFISNF